MTKALSTLGGLAGAGALVWTASQIHRGSTGGYWAATAVLAAAGLVLGLGRLPGSGTGGRPRPAVATLALSFVPALVAAGWVLLAAQPNGGWLARHVASWSRGAHVGAIVGDLGVYAPVLAFGLGLTLGFVFERRAAVTATARDDRPATPTETSGSVRTGAEARQDEEWQQESAGAGRAAGEE